MSSRWQISPSPRLAAWAGLYIAILASWLALLAMNLFGETAAFSGVPPGLWETLCVSAGEARLAPLVLMWALMAVAMMAPTFVPALRTFLDLPAAANSGGRDALLLVAGFLAIWFAASIGGAVAQQQLSRAALVSPTGQSVSDGLTAALLLSAGSYQFSHLKAACLSRCRRPLAFFMERWRPGSYGALRMGAELGLACLGCCWALMLLAFAGGTMNLAWMGLATLFMTFEKLPEIGRWLTGPAGAALIVAGLWMTARWAGLA